MSQHKVIPVSMDQYLKLLKAGKIKFLQSPQATGMKEKTQPSHVEEPKLVSNEENGHSCPSQKSMAMEETASSLGKTTAPAPVENLCWSAQAAFQMLAVYESKKGSPSFSKHDKKFWAEIAEDLNAGTRKLFPRDIDWKQVKDKFHNVKGSMNGKRDWNRNSGNDPKKMTEMEKRAEEIIHGKKDAGTENTHEVNLQTFCLSGTSHPSQPDSAEDVDHPGIATPDSVSVTTPRSVIRERLHSGTGLNRSRSMVLDLMSLKRSFSWNSSGWNS